jgi:HK97 gp10 family phage protein
MEGLSEVKANLRKLVTISREGSTDVAMQGALVFERGAKGRAPVDTGKLRASITSQPDDNEAGLAHVFTNTEYAPDQELGTARQSGTPFFRPTMDSDASQIFRVIAEAYKELLENGFR